MKKSSIVLCALLLVVGVTAFAQNPAELNGKHYFRPQGWAKPGGGGAQNLIFHTGGSVIRNANVVMIFWGPSFGPGGSDAAYAAELQGFRNQFGTTGEYNTITQYYGEDSVSGFGNIAQSNLAVGTGDWFDTSTPPTNVTDSAVQGEVVRYLQTHTFNNNTVYEVFIPGSSYSSSGSSTSCGGPNLQYCAYHGNFSSGGHDVKYSIEPYPSCGGCHASGFTVTQDQEHFVCHETREAVTDADLNAWFDRRGFEADDKCAWSPAPFIGSGGFGYQYEWSNADKGCVRTK
jgi:hypothetical protein